MEEAKQDLSRVWIDEPKSLFQFLDSYKDLESKVVANLQEQAKRTNWRSIQQIKYLRPMEAQAFVGFLCNYSIRIFLNFHKALNLNYLSNSAYILHRLCYKSQLRRHTNEHNGRGHR